MGKSRKYSEAAGYGEANMASGEIYKESSNSSFRERNNIFNEVLLCWNTVLYDTYVGDILKIITLGSGKSQSISHHISFQSKFTIQIL